MSLPDRLLQGARSTRVDMFPMSDKTCLRKREHGTR
jgi:hypothetical protein